MKKIYRPGPVGALLDEYERATEELKSLVAGLSQKTFTAIADAKTKDPACVSIQAVLNHVVRGGYGYANFIRKEFGNPHIPRKENYKLDTPAIACAELDKMMRYTEETLADKYDITEKQAFGTVIVSGWGQKFDFEQLWEHAIVHILRHRRQIEKFLLKLDKQR